MTQLTNAQLDLLSAAAANDSGASADGFASATVRALIKRGYLISLPKIDGPSHLLATDQGSAALAPSADEYEPAAKPGLASTEHDAPAAAGEETTQAPIKPPGGKIAVLVALLRRPDGARIDEMMDATGWQAHSVRGAISGAIKKGLGLAVASEKADGQRTYRIGEAAQ